MNLKTALFSSITVLSTILLIGCGKETVISPEQNTTTTGRFIFFDDPWLFDTLTTSLQPVPIDKNDPVRPIESETPIINDDLKKSVIPSVPEAPAQGAAPIESESKTGYPPAPQAQDPNVIQTSTVDPLNSAESPNTGVASLPSATPAK